MLQKLNALPCQYHTLCNPKLTVKQEMSQWKKGCCHGQENQFENTREDTGYSWILLVRQPQNGLFFKTVLPRPGFKGLPESTCLGYSAQFLKYQLSSFLRNKHIADNNFFVFLRRCNADSSD